MADCRATAPALPGLQPVIQLSQTGSSEVCRECWHVSTAMLQTCDHLHPGPPNCCTVQKYTEVYPSKQLLHRLNWKQNICINWNLYLQINHHKVIINNVPHPLVQATRWEVWEDLAAKWKKNTLLDLEMKGVSPFLKISRFLHHFSTLWRHLLTTQLGPLGRIQC